MSTKRIFSWSKRQSTSEPYYRTGGLLPIDAHGHDSSNGFEAKIIAKTGRQRPSNLKIIPPDNKQFNLSPVPAPYNVALALAASNLQAAFNEMLRSPAPTAVACARPPSIQKPLPSRPRSSSAPSTPDLPAELPGSLLQDNQGFPSEPSPVTAVHRPVSQTVRRSTHPLEIHCEIEEENLALLDLFPEPLAHAKSFPDMSARHGPVRPVRSGTALNSSTVNKPSPLRVQHKKSLNETSSRRRSKPNLVTSPTSADSKLTAVSVSTSEEGADSPRKARAGGARLLQPAPLIVEGKTWQPNVQDRESYRNELGATSTPTPTTTRSKHIEELKSTITTQDQTISTLQAQFGSLRSTHEAHVASLVDAHVAEIASLKNYARVLEQQLAQKPSQLHHASSNNLLFLLDTTEPPETPSRESSQHTAGTGSANSIKSFSSALEKQPRSPQRVRNSPEMESLRRKLSTTKRPETTNRNLLPELNQYRQNNVALQKQIESLMAKLNESKKGERELRNKLEASEKECMEWQDKASASDKVTKNVQALQNTIDHLENRLEIANTERLDAEEQLFHLQKQKSPFDLSLPKLQVPAAMEQKSIQNAHMSMSTVFSSDSPTASQETESQELSTLAAFIAHIERLQDQVRQKDHHIAELEEDLAALRTQHGHLEQERTEAALQLDIQHELLRKTKQTDAHVEQLRTAIIDREAIIGEKEKSIRAIERQLEYHQMLLQAEIRKHATMKLHTSIEDDPLPELTSLTSKADVDKWINQLKQRLRREQPMSEPGESANETEAQAESLQQEIDFYIREIIYYKLDIKGYKSDIRKLKRITAQLGSYGSRASDLESDTSSLKPANTPSRSRFISTTPELGASGPTSPVCRGPVSNVESGARPSTPPPSGYSPVDQVKPTYKRIPQQLNIQVPMTPQTPIREGDYNFANKVDDLDPGISPRSVVRLSPERRKPTPPSPHEEMFGELLTNFPLSTPAAPQRHDTQRSMSDSIIQLYTAPRTPEGLPLVQNETPVRDRGGIWNRGRSASASDANKGKVMPERPPRPQYGLFNALSSTQMEAISSSSPPHLNILAKTTSRSPGSPITIRPLMSRNNSNSSSVRAAAPTAPREFRDRAGSAPAPMNPLTFRSRADSLGSSTSNAPYQTSPPPERKLSAASGSNIPFVIAMGSPHNPALLTPTTSLPPTPCSITRNAPLTINASISRTGVGGTMASSTPVTSPISPTDASRPEPPPKTSTPKPVSVSSAFSSHARKLSVSKKQDDENTRPLRTPSHSRNVSASSIRTAIRLPKGKGKEKEEAHKMRKDSISMPRPLGSPFSIVRSGSVDRRGEEEKRGGGEYVYGIGEAI